MSLDSLTRQVLLPITQSTGALSASQQHTVACEHTPAVLFSQGYPVLVNYGGAKMTAGSLGAYHNRNLGAVLTPITNQQVLIMAAMGGLAGVALSYLSPSAANESTKNLLGKQPLGRSWCSSNWRWQRRDSRMAEELI